MAHVPAGSRLPDVEFGVLDLDEVNTVRSQDVFARCRAVVIGVPGAFTPVCTRKHVPDFVAKAEKLRAAGYDKLVCVAPNDPFVIAEWVRTVDPDHRLIFLSDGNLDFARALRLQKAQRPLHLGLRSERYMLIVESLVITRIRVEPDILTFSSTGADEALDLG